jgi:predicted Rdx family selenoprotein
VITPGEKSQFDVLADGNLIFSKASEGRFPEEDEILTALALL